MIILDELKPILEELIGEREDGADIVDRVSALDKEIEPVVDQEAIDAAVSAALEANNKEWNDKYLKAFFGEKAENMSTEAPTETPAEPEPPFADEDPVDDYADVPSLDTIIEEMITEKKEEE